MHEIKGFWCHSFWSLCPIELDKLSDIAIADSGWTKLTKVNKSWQKLTKIGKCRGKGLNIKEKNMRKID